MDARRVLKCVWFTPGVRGRWGLPVMFEGPPGSAKTAQGEGAAAALNLHCETVIASLREPADFLGLPIPQANKAGHMRVNYAPPAWAVRLTDAGRGVGFFDELNTAPPAVQAALLRCVLDGWVGDLLLPHTVRFVAAQNATHEAAGGWDLAPPLANRFGHFKWEVPDAASWADWMLGSDHTQGEPESKFDPEAEEARVLKVWAEPFAKARGLVTAFVRAKSDLLHKQPAAGDPQASKAWPSPRTWEMATRALAGAQVHDLSPVDREELMTAFVGTAAAAELMSFVTNSDLPDPADVLDGKVKFVHDTRRLDRSVAVLSSCAAMVSPPNAAKREPRAEKLWEIVGEVVKDSADIGVQAARVLVKAKLSSLVAARPALVKLQPVLAAAGIRP